MLAALALAAAAAAQVTPVPTAPYGAFGPRGPVGKNILCVVEQSLAVPHSPLIACIPLCWLADPAGH